MTLDDFRRAVADDLGALDALSGVAVETWDGRFDPEALRMMAPRAPAVFLGVQLLTDFQRAGDAWWCEASMAAVVLTQDRAGRPRDAQALDYAPAIAARVLDTERTPWDGLTEGQALDPSNVRADNLAALKLDKRGLAMWAVTWRQRIKLVAAEAY